MWKLCVFVFVVILKSLPNDAIFLVIPEDVPAGFAAIYGFAPPLAKGINGSKEPQFTSKEQQRKCLASSRPTSGLGESKVLGPEITGTRGNDHRLGFGFRLGNHADFQILYEFGPQTVTKPLQASRARSTSRQRFVRRRPVFELLVRAGFLNRSSYKYNIIHDCDDEPR